MGCAVGRSDGFHVGAADGDGDGASVGLNVGFAVGAIDGSYVGTADGEGEGIIVGSAVGSNLIVGFRPNRYQTSLGSGLLLPGIVPFLVSVVPDQSVHIQP